MGDDGRNTTEKTWSDNLSPQKKRKVEVVTSLNAAATAPATTENAAAAAAKKKDHEDMMTTASLTTAATTASPSHDAVAVPGAKDVICGRGNASKHPPGNEVK